MTTKIPVVGLHRNSAIVYGHLYIESSTSKAERETPGASKKVDD